MATSRRRTLEQRFFGGGPKRVLSIDGGGVRGLLSTGILTEIERRLARRCGRDDFRLCEYFDLIGGASTGALLAAALAMGMSCAEATEVYREIAPTASLGKGRAASLRRPRFDQARLDAALDRLFGDQRLSSTSLRTGLSIFLKRIDTGVVWTMSNNPRSRFWEAGPEGSTPFKNLLLRRLVQASVAAPVLFEETRVRIADDGGLAAPAEGVFVDSALAGLNNPCLELLKVATLDSYGFGWPTGDDQIFMVSVGAGHWTPRVDEKMLVSASVDEVAPAAFRAAESLRAMIHDTGLAALSTLQALSRSPRPWVINDDVGDMRTDHLSPFPILSFQRFDVGLDRPSLKELDLDLGEADIARMREPIADDGSIVTRLHETGIRAGQSYFRSAASKDARDWDSIVLPPRFDPQFFAERSVGQPRNRLDAMGRLFDRAPQDGD